MRRFRVFAVVLAVFCSVASSAQQSDWQPKHIEELPPGPHRISKQLSDLLHSILRPEAGDDRCSEPDPERFSSLRFVELGSNERTQVIVQGVGPCQCSPTGNCSFWVYQQSANGYRLLLRRGAVQAFSIEDTRSHGYRDIVTAMHGSAFESGLTVFKFDGTRYQRRECWNMSYPEPDSNSTPTEPKPILKKIDCHPSAK
jgi:hypothetical protein